MARLWRRMLLHTAFAFCLPIAAVIDLWHACRRIGSAWKRLSVKAMLATSCTCCYVVWLHPYCVVVFRWATADANLVLGGVKNSTFGCLEAMGRGTAQFIAGAVVLSYNFVVLAVELLQATPIRTTAMLLAAAVLSNL